MIKLNHLSYRVDNTNQKKTLVVGNYDFSSYLDNIYYILTYHTSNSKISSLEKRANTYLNREVTEYYREKMRLVKPIILIIKQVHVCISVLIQENKKLFVK